MKRLLLLCALLLVCSFTPRGDWRSCSIETDLLNGKGYRIGGGYVLTVHHLFCEDGACVSTCKVNGNPGCVIQTGTGGELDSPSDDDGDWALVYVEAYQADPPCTLRAPVEGELLTYRGFRAKVRTVSGSVASFDGRRPVPGDSGSGVVDKDGALCGLLTTRTAARKDGPHGYFCCISPDIEAAIAAAKDSALSQRPQS